ncbi:MAG: ABC transporter substrate-binding protein [Planctomycetota bacterium]
MDIAIVIADAWAKNLGVNVKLLNQEWKVYLDTQSTLGYDVSRSAWIGDYADPNNFIDLFVTGGENNKTGWGNPEFDELIEVAKYTTDEAARSQAMLDAERILLDEMPVLPIYSYVTQNIVSPRLGGFHSNLLNEHFPKYWYWMDDEELAERRAKLPPDKRIVDPGGPPEGLYSPAGKANQIGRDPR